MKGGQGSRRGRAWVMAREQQHVRSGGSHAFGDLQCPRERAEISGSRKS